MKLTTHELKDIASDVQDCRPIGFNKIYALLQHIKAIEAEAAQLDGVLCERRTIIEKALEDDKQ